MIRFQADAELDNDIVMAVRQRDHGVDFQTATGGKLTGLKDPEVLGVAAAQNQRLITHDRRTSPRHFRDRIESGETSPASLSFHSLSQSVPLWKPCF